MTVARKRGLYVASLVGAVLAGFAGHWIVPAAVKEAPAAVTSDHSISLDQRLQSIDLTLQEMRRDLSVQQTDVRVIKCYLHLDNLCPPDVRP